MRSDAGQLNTHFRIFAKPMGMTADGNRLTIGDANTVWDYRNMPALAQKLEPPGRHDGCYVPRRMHVTGDIDIHELAYDAQDELWVVNTRFCCLCTLDKDHSFRPRWRPPFVSALAPEDRCHLNGLGMVDGRPKYVTALGQADTPGGWRANKASGGVLMDIETNEILLQGLSMPHSPRWYEGKLWFLESGQGSLAVADLKRGTWKTVVEVPGFTRGIDFYGPLAFIGLSEVRESAVFSGIPLVRRLTERTCGVWVVNIQTAETVGFLRFEAGVQEIFAVQVLRGIRFPELLEWGDARLAHAYVLPDAALAEVALPNEEALARSPAYHLERGTSLYRKGEHEEAIDAYRHGLALAPNDPHIRYHLGVALGDAEHYEEAAACLKQVIEAEPGKAEAHNSLGYVLSCMDRPQEAVACYERAIELKPDYIQAHFNLGMTLLKLGDYERGWGEYEWRWRSGEFTPFRCPHPQWDGQPIPEQTLLIHTEQGAGDTLQFARYLPWAARRCRMLILVCVPDLMPLLSTLPGVAELREPGTIQVSEFDTYLPLLSLPRVYGTALDTIPAEVPYFDLTAVARRKNAAALRLEASFQPKVGIVWAGSPTHRGNRRRSCPLNAFLPMLRTPDVAFYSVQKGERSADLEQIPGEIGVEDLASRIGDFGDTALLLDQLDLLIAVDTSVAHLAGALGKPVWVLLGDVSDWRWLRNRDTNPWYPTARLFRQSRPGDWGELMQRVAQALAAWRHH
ncbi:MAG: TIGR03032 family protein [Pseudomonadota bacterium]